MKFKRNIEPQKAIEDAFVNSFYKQGFINDDVFDRDSRDIWKAFINLLSNANSSSVFSTSLVSYKRLPYSPELVQRNMTDNNSRKKTVDGYDDDSGEIFVDIKMDYYAFYECVFIISPYSLGPNPKNKSRIENTIRIIERDYAEKSGYTVIPSTAQALFDCRNILSSEFSNNEHTTDDLFIRDKKLKHVTSIVRIIAPMLIDDSFYMIDGIRTYPIITEAYHYTTSQFGQKEFVYKTNVSKTSKKSNGVSHYELKMGYFDSAFLDMGKGPEIFYIKTSSNKFYNPLMFLNKPEAEKLVNDILADKYITARNKQILRNTYKHYLANIDEIRDIHTNQIPNIKVWKDNDSFFNERVESSYQDDNFKTWRFNRRVVSNSLIKSLIYGFNNIRFYSFYAHMADAYLINVSKHSKAAMDDDKAKKMKTDLMPKDKIIYATIRSNKELCANYDNKNPYDVWARTSYRKFINPPKNELENVKVKNAEVKKNLGSDDSHPRYLTEEEYTLINPTTVKSENTAGLVSTFTLFNHRKYAFRKAEEL